MADQRSDARRERDRALGTLHGLTRGGPVAAAAAVVGFGALAAVTYSGSASAGTAPAGSAGAVTPIPTTRPTESAAAAATASRTATPAPTLAPTPAPTAVPRGGGHVSTGSS